MMLNYFEKVKNYLLDLGHDVVSEDAPEGILVVTDQSKGLLNTLLDCEGEILIVEQHILDMAADNSAAHKRLLQINRTLVHGAFVLNEDGTKLIFRDTLELANLDENELEGSLNALTIALVEYTDELLSFANATVDA